MVISLNVMEMRLKRSKNELILLDQNFSATLINSASSEVFRMVRLMNRSIPNAIQRPLECGENLVIHAPHHFQALGHDLVRFTIGRNFFPKSSSVADLNRKGKLGGGEDASLREFMNYDEEDAPPREFLNSNPGKGEEWYCKEKNDDRTSTN